MSENSTDSSVSSDADGSNNVTHSMPDVAAASKPSQTGTLNWVGMGSIAVPLQVQTDAGSSQQLSATAQIHVDLMDAHAKGIHMSRLYLLLERFGEAGPAGSAEIVQLLNDVVSSHQGLSESASLELKFDYLLKRPALKSDNSGWKAYPVTLNAQLLSGELKLNLTVDVPYSSTCPCSAALARQLVQEQFSADFAGQSSVSVEQVEAWLRTEKGTYATPHSQRSVAKVIVAFDQQQQQLPLKFLIDTIESALQTPVQTAVKREDEQEFARLNGQNLMFCEDAARRLKASLNSSSFSDFWLRVEHLESLHAHDAVAVASKGIAGGFTPRLNP